MESIGIPLMGLTISVLEKCGMYLIFGSCNSNTLEILKEYFVCAVVILNLFLCDHNIKAHIRLRAERFANPSRTAGSHSWKVFLVRRDCFANRSRRAKSCRLFGEHKGSRWDVFECSSSFPVNLLRTSNVKPEAMINGSRELTPFPCFAVGNNFFEWFATCSASKYIRALILLRT
ncbi:hypothetical protein AVEN_219854-1 [Araneus ventricosus]|uniref:Uncharacterized protein n=1 Tax=Araneus ventricosus TaxID=182803 RepID=A0A4Y2RBK6_ARAVE|nr:hypothetical protein AVEN_71887-1 [Araneus ventricosus]GBN72179.1 hypothetical protein AVEN_105213-1 [Araneus ventricosus]GBN72182.1 hypothetical protein AVEN_113314-1 [Araneus ventricosus]GBN72195.1 hypothetical protein AVEN_219854-1 [Araneus ventricosus]